MATRKPLVSKGGVLSELSSADNIAQSSVDSLVPTLQDLQARLAAVEASAYYTHVQNIAAAVWNVTHGLGRYPAITVVDSALTEVEGGVEHINVDTVQITFSAAFAGKAFFS